MKRWKLYQDPKKRKTLPVYKICRPEIISCEEERNVSKILVWFKPSQQRSITQVLAHYALGGTGERIGKLKVRKLMG